MKIGLGSNWMHRGCTMHHRSLVGLLLIMMMVTVVNLKPLPGIAIVAGDEIAEFDENGEMDTERYVRSAQRVARRRLGVAVDGVTEKIGGVVDKIGGVVEKTVEKIKDFWQINRELCPPPLAHLCSIQVPGPNGGMQSAFVTPFFEGDIILDPQERRQQGLANMQAAPLRSRPRRPRRPRRAIIKGRDQRWHEATVPYIIDDDFNAETAKIIKSALRHWQQRTCIRFVPKKASHRDYLRFAYYPGCWSYIGRQGGEQLVSMGPGCNVFETIIHEVGHAIGFWHEQSRRDRDSYVQVVNRNIAPGTEENFGKVDAVNVTSRGYPYDFESIMHYSSTAFSVNGKPTIRMKKKYQDLLPEAELGQHHGGLSDLDIAQTRGLYDCNERAAKKQKKKPCVASEAGDGREYRGEVDFTEGDITCQRWTSQYPHEHSYVSDDAARNEQRGLGDHNFCRNPAGRRERPWCYTTLRKKVWDYCDIKICSSTD